MAENKTKIDPRLENMFDITAVKAQIADQASDSETKHLHSETDLSGDGSAYHESMGDPRGPQWVGVLRPSAYGRASEISAHVRRDDEAKGAVYADTRISGNSEEGQSKTVLNIFRNGTSKELVSTNPVVANRVANIAIKGVNRQADRKIDAGVK